jgi:uncharacterized membrane protein YkvA (DUF1232 family)
MRRLLEHWKQRAHRLKTELYALYLAYKDPRVPWYARIFAAAVVGYAFSPIDLIPDPIPVLGYLDDLVLVPIGIALALRMIPPPVLAECRIKAQAIVEQGKPANWVAAGVIVALWLLLAVLAIRLTVTFLGDQWALWPGFYIRPAWSIRNAPVSRRSRDEAPTYT